MPVTLNPITRQVMGRDDTVSHCSPVVLLPINVINEATFLPRVSSNAPYFGLQQPQHGRLGVFAVTAGTVTRAWILLLPESGTPDRVMIGIFPPIAQRGGEAYYRALGAGDPLSVPLIRDAVALITGLDPVSNAYRAGLVQACYGSQILGSRRPMALLVPVRSLAGGGGTDPQLGPFASDGQVISETVAAIETATDGAFHANVIEGFTHSAGIVAFNALLRAVAGRFAMRNAITLDPAPAQSIAPGLATAVMQHLSGETGGIVNGRPAGNFEYWPYERWRHDPQRVQVMRMVHNNAFNYLHNYAVPRYLLRLSIQRTSG